MICPQLCPAKPVNTLMLVRSSILVPFGGKDYSLRPSLMEWRACGFQVGQCCRAPRVLASLWFAVVVRNHSFGNSDRAHHRGHQSLRHRRLPMGQLRVQSCLQLPDDGESQEYPVLLIVGREVFPLLFDHPLWAPLRACGLGPEYLSYKSPGQRLSK